MTASTPDSVARLRELLHAPAQDDESAHDAGERRERELKALFASLAPTDALAIRKRLQANKPDDELATAFRRLTIERRDRLLAFLADPRRPFWVSG